MYESHDMRHTGFSQVDSGQRDPRDLGRHSGCNPFVDHFLDLDLIFLCANFYKKKTYAPLWLTQDLKKNQQILTQNTIQLTTI